MDRRLRSPTRRPACPRAGERPRGAGAGAGSVSPHRFLRPGALARLRDSKLLARSLRCAARAPLPTPPSSPPQSPASAAGDGVPCFLGPAARGMMRYPLRKKLAAARSVVFLPPPEAADVFLDVFAAAAAAAADMVAAH